MRLFLTTLADNPTKIFFLLSLIAVCVIVPLRFACSEYGEDILIVLIILFLSLYLALYFGRYRNFCLVIKLNLFSYLKKTIFRGFRLTATFVYNINTIMKEDIKKWLLIYSIFLIGFSQSLIFFLLTTLRIMLPSHYQFWLPLPSIHHRDTPVSHRPSPSLTVLYRSPLKDGEGRECHDDTRSVTMGHDDLKMVTGQIIIFTVNDSNFTQLGHQSQSHLFDRETFGIKWN